MITVITPTIVHYEATPASGITLIKRQQITRNPRVFRRGHLRIFRCPIAHLRKNDLAS